MATGRPAEASDVINNRNNRCNVNSAPRAIPLFSNSSSAKYVPRVINCVLLNARSVCNKLPALYQLLYSDSYDTILITETWLKALLPDSILDPYGQYTIVRCNRQTVGGRVCAFIRKPLTVAEISPYVRTVK